MIIGYARVSTTDQNLAAQTDALTAAGAERLFSERVSGAKAERPELDKMLHQLRNGDDLRGRAGRRAGARFSRSGGAPGGGCKRPRSGTAWGGFPEAVGASSWQIRGPRRRAKTRGPQLHAGAAERDHGEGCGP